MKEKTGRKCCPEKIAQQMRQIQFKIAKGNFFSEESLSSSLQMGSYFSDLVRADNSLNTKDDLHVKATEHDFHELVMAA